MFKDDASVKNNTKSIALPHISIVSWGTQHLEHPRTSKQMTLMAFPYMYLRFSFRTIILRIFQSIYMWGSNISIYLHVGLQMDPVEKSKDVLSVVSPMF